MANLYFCIMKFHYTYYSGSETRSRAFITSSRRVSGIKPLSKEVTKLIRKRNKMLSRNTEFTQKYKYCTSLSLKLKNKWWGSRRHSFQPLLYHFKRMQYKNCRFIIYTLNNLILAKNSICIVIST